MGDYAVSGELATIPPTVSGPNDRMMALRATPSDQLPDVLDEIHERSLIIRRRIRDEMTEGTHYGFPPGVKKSDADPKRWTAKPSLYQAGADAVIHWESVIPEFEECEAAWRMLGSVPGKLILKCKLRSSITEKVLGEGLGAAHVFEKASDFDLNKGVKMAQKRAKVSAVLNTYSLGDLFTQDLEDKPQPEAPSQDPKAPKSQPRTERVSKEELGELLAAFQKQAVDREQPAGKSDFTLWVSQVTSMARESVFYASSWMRPDFDLCWREMEGGDE
jgi:hypothetical protein